MMDKYESSKTLRNCFSNQLFLYQEQLIHSDCIPENRKKSTIDRRWP